MVKWITKKLGKVVHFDDSEEIWVLPEEQTTSNR